MVAAAIAAGAGVCTVNIAETAAILVREGMPFDEVESLLSRLPVTVHIADRSLAFATAKLYLRGRRLACR